MARLIRPISLSPSLSFKDFHERRNKILITRDTGGLGDIMMCRMLFEDFKIQMPDCHLIFACPIAYHSAVEDHPFIDEIMDSNTVNENDFLASYNITSACGRYENAKAPYADKHRSDIWADHCGISLTKHDMHIKLDKNVLNICKSKLNEYKDHRPLVLFSPISAIRSKNLDTEQIVNIANLISETGCKVVGVHKMPIDGLETIVPNSFKELFCFIELADYIITVDTAAFHIAGGLKKPTVGIFSWACGKTYGQYYDFQLVQRHRDYTPDWTCGPCYVWTLCKKSKEIRKPCITEIKPQEVANAFMKLRK